ncbi:MAG: carbohydrate ABC transporter substrate-binding protein [Bauldia sp.]|nr:carbohydrate ABC transporter substrate-binding protein [Bauldia sp.]
MRRILLAGVSAAAVIFTSVAPGFSQSNLAFPIGEGAFSWQSLADFSAAHQGLQGQELTIWSPWNNEGDAAQWESVWRYFENATGVTVRAASSPNYEEQARIDIAAGAPSNILILPQPGLLADFAAQGALTPLGAGVQTFIEQNYAAGPSWAALGQFAGPDGTVAQYALPYKQETKSFIWYSPDNFAEMGYEVPTTMEELMELEQQIIADGGTPWCIGVESGGATGWAATDWIEDLMLRNYPPEVYDQWVRNEIPFNDPRVVDVINQFGRIALDNEMVAGGTAAIAATPFGDSPLGLFTVPPQCYLHRQASFIASFFPEGTVAGEDYDFFYMPPFASKPELGRPVLGSGTLVTIAKDSPAARAFIDFLMTPIAHEIWMAAPNSAFLTALTTANQDVYSSPGLRAQGEILTTATTFRFDASDLMPGPIGAGAFWTGMVDFLGGVPAETVATRIQAAWDAIK